jgi:hypothetical protein
MFYTYAHLRNDNGQIFYIGKGTGRRMYRKSARNLHWHNVVAKAGYTPILLANWKTEKEAYEHEKFLIKCFEGSLVNQSSGGDGNDASGGLSFAGRKHTEQAKQKCRQIHLGKPKSDQSKALNAEAHKKKIKVDEVTYESWKEASAKTGIPMGSISYLLKNSPVTGKWAGKKVSLVM